MKNIMKKILIVDPYLDVFGGGEKHILSIAKVFEEHGYAVALFWNDENILSQLSDKLKIDVSSFTVEKEERKGEGFDVLLYVTDGSYFIPKAKKNYVFCMYPQKSIYASSLLNKLKWRGWDFFANSEFTAKYISQWVGKKAGVVYPHIEDAIFSQYSPIEKKKKVILSVGRFFRHLHAKNQHLLVEAFNTLQARHKELADFKLVLVGSVKKEDEAYFEEVKSLAQKNENIILVKNALYSEWLQYYKASLFYWHGAGLGADLNEHPEATEHLGISVLEAMIAGCVTFAHNSGGPREIIENGKTGFLYDTIEELVSKTAEVNAVGSELQTLSTAAKAYGEQNFSSEVFKRSVEEYFKLDGDPSLRSG